MLRMTKLQSEIVKTLGVKTQIVPGEEIRKRINFLKDYCRQASAKGFVLGISGGQDSTLAGRLAQLACKELREEGYEAKFTAVRLPYGEQKDEADAQLALQFIQPDKKMIYNIEKPVTNAVLQYQVMDNHALSDFHKGNIKARMRMIAQYAIAGESNLLVIGTDHAAEAVTGFFTKYGDGAADVLPLSGLTKRQGKSLLIELNAPEKLYEKKPTADLLDSKPGQEDETELGLTYDQIDDYLEGKEVLKEVAEKIEERYKKTQHKRELPVTPN